MNRFPIFIIVFSLSVCISLMCGCGNRDSVKRFAVSGTVKLDGTPVTSGNIEFQGLTGNIHKMNGGALIDSGGHFTIPAQQGLPEGMYQVILAVENPKQEKVKNAAKGRSPSYMQIEYQDHLSISSGQNTFDLDIASR